MGEKTECENCSMIKCSIEQYCGIAYEIYVNDTYNWLLLNTPVKIDDKVIMGNSRNFNFPRFDGESYIKEIIKRLNLENTEYKLKNDKIQVLNLILGYLYDELTNLIKLNSVNYLVSLVSNMEYNRFLAQNIVLWFSNKNNRNFERTNDNFANIILDSLDFVKSFESIGLNNIQNPICIKEIYSDLEVQLASDRLSLEIAIENAYHIVKESGDTFIKEKNSFEYGQVLGISRAINEIRLLKVEFSEGMYEKEDLNITYDGFIRTSNNLSFSSVFYEKYYRDMSNRKSFFSDEEIEQKISKIVKIFYGLNLEQMLSLREGVSNTYNNGDEFLIGDKDTWIMMIKFFTSCNNEEAELAFEYLTLHINRDELFKDVSKKKSRITRNCLVKINDLFICPVGLLKYSLLGFYKDLKNGDVSNLELKNRLHEITGIEDEKFETAVYKDLKDNLVEPKIKANIGQKDILNNGKCIELPGQIDVLLLYKDHIYVIECKNTNLRTTPKSVANEYGKYKKINKKSVQYKLSQKINVINENKRDVIEFMGECFKEYANIKVSGVITTSSFSVASLDEDLLYPVITWTNLSEWIIEKSK